MTKDNIELVLPDGTFCQIRRPNVGDMISCMDSGSGFDIAVKLLSICASFDGETKSYQEICAMDFEVCSPALNRLAKLVEAFSPNGVA